MASGKPDIRARPFPLGAPLAGRRAPFTHLRGRRSLAGCAWLAVACLSALSPERGHAQVLQLWSHMAAFGDASAAVAMGDSLMFVANNENEVLGLYSRRPADSCRVAVWSLNARPYLSPTGSDSSADLESAVKLNEANGPRIYWLSSLSNNKNGALRPNRDRLFATQISGNGAGSPPYSLTYVGRYDYLREDIIAWDVNNLHGRGANYFGLAASAAHNVAPQQVDGFNVEGLTVSPDGQAAYIAFRAPLVNGSGPTTPTSQRTHALIIQLLNMPALVTGDPTPGPGAALLGAPILLPLGNRGIRSIDFMRKTQYLITAGPADAVSNPPVAPLNFRLFTWTGYPASPPSERATTFAATYSPEACILPNEHITSQTIAQFINDDGSGNGCWRSMTCYVGTNVPSVDAPLVRPSGGVRFGRAPGPSPARQGVSFTITVPHEQPVELSVIDLAGRRIATLWHGNLAAGEHDFWWEGTAADGVREGTGVYWVELRGADGTDARRFVLMR